MRRLSLMVVLVVLAAGCTRRGSNPPPPPGASGIRTSPGATASGGPASSGSPSAGSPSASAGASASPGGSAAPSPGAQAGDPGSPLRPVPGNQPLFGDPSRPCEAPLATGWERGDCVQARMQSGRVVAFSEHRPGDGAVPRWRVSVYRMTGSGWVAALRAVGEDETWSEVRVRQAPLVPGTETIVVGYRYAGSGQLLDYDVVVWTSGSAPFVRKHREGLSHGSVTLHESRADEYSADYPHGQPNCCPSRFSHSVLRYADGSFTVSSAGYVRPNDVPPSDL